VQTRGNASSAQAPRAMGKQHQQPTRDRHVLLEMEELIAVAEPA
jgi:hypothetical protein